MQKSNERGIALITTMLVLMLISALLIGFTTVVMSDQRYRFIDGDRVKAFYGASGGMEKLTADLGNLFLKNVAPTNAQVLALTGVASQPSISGVTFTAVNQPDPLPASELTSFYCTSTPGPPAVNRQPVVVGTPGYTITFCANTATNNPTTTAEVSTIKTGPYEGLMALKAPYQIDVTAKTATFGEVHLVRTIEAVAIPVFQFGIFSDVDLGFNAADDFSFGGRVHTNGSLFLSQGDGTTLTLSEKVTAVKEVVRQRLSNGATIDSSNKDGTIKLTKGGGAYVTMDRTWGSVVDGPTSAQNEPTWHTTSLSTYKNYIRNGRTGARQLNLPLINVSVGGKNTDLTRRPPAAESPLSILFNERLFSKASIRVLLSDTAADIANLPSIDNAIAPVSLEAGASFGVVPHVTAPIPIATSPGAVAGVTVGTVAGGSTTTTIRVNAPFPTYYQAPALVATSLLTGLQWSINCTAKTANTFLNCAVATIAPNLVGTIPIGSPVTPVAPGTVNGVAASVPTTALVLVGGARTVTLSTVAPNAGTAAFAPQTFWIDDNVVTCTAYDLTVPQFSACTSLMTANPANGKLITTFAMSPQNTSLIGGFIKIERLNASDSTWHDITAEILGYGIGAPSQVISTSGLNCDTLANDPSPNAIIRLQRLHDSGQVNNTTANCTPKAGASKYDYWPNTLFDGREGWPRDNTPAGANIKIGGVMHYIAIDAGNLAEWFAHAAPYNTAGDTGNLSKPDNGGYSIYISDRRNNRNLVSQETGEYGWEDFVNPLSATATPNGALDTGEDLNATTDVGYVPVLDVYGGHFNCNGAIDQLQFNGVTCALAAPATYTSFYQAALGPMSDMVSPAESAAGLNGIGRAMVNRPLMFRRAIELIHGGSIATNVTGFTLVTENPVYMRGDWNATQALGFTGAHAATSVIGDAFTALSSNWSDPISFVSPYSAGGRSKRTGDSYYRLAVLAGKGALFPQPVGTSSTYGTDGGAHSFIRYLEDNAAAGADTIHYKGSLATFYYNRQGVGVFKGTDGVVYGIPANRDFSFDTDFLIPALLPPLTPVFRDMNAVGFSQELRPGK
jgi:hypothetical protein